MGKKQFVDDSDDEELTFSAIMADIMLGDLVPPEKREELLRKKPEMTETESKPKSKSKSKKPPQ